MISIHMWKQKSVSLSLLNIQCMNDLFVISLRDAWGSVFFVPNPVPPRDIPAPCPAIPRRVTGTDVFYKTLIYFSNEKSGSKI